MVERAQVVLFLDLMRACAECSFRLEHRTKNMATLAQVGITIEDAKARVLALTPDCYVEGPIPRPENPSQEAWVFGMTIQQTQVYLKVSVRLEPARCLCISFHEAEYPMRFPYACGTEGAGER
ncbi:MAG: hypothetical protein Q8M55_07525 [Actinomycetota bacterium]|nr:hypothetical protein [Actinomycetota bacterium]